MKRPQRPCPAPAHFPYNHRTVAQVDKDHRHAREYRSRRKQGKEPVEDL